MDNNGNLAQAPPAAGTTAITATTPTPTTPKTTMMQLPHELIEEILVLCDPIDVIKVAMSCRRMYEIVYGGILVSPASPTNSDNTSSTIRARGRKAFWRALYLAQPLDDIRKAVNWLGEPRVARDRQTTERFKDGDDTEEDVGVDELLDEDGDNGIDWQRELQKVIRARTVVGNLTLCKGEPELREVLTIFLDLVKWVPVQRDSRGMVELSKNLVWVPVILKEFLDVVERGVWCSSDELEEEQEGKDSQELQWRVPPKSKWGEETRQLHAQLHVLYGLTRKDLLKSTRVESRAYVYDMRRYTAENEYGPLRNDGESVDWEHLQRIHHLVSMHVVWAAAKELIENEDEESDFEFLLYPMSMPFTHTVLPRRYGLGGIPPVEVQEEETEAIPEGGDWAGIEGTWAVCFCFIDHRDLIAFNISGDTNGTLDPSMFEEEDFVEVFRRLEVKLHVTRLANDPEHPGRPIIGFVGAMLAPSTSTMYGSVQLTGDNHVKWQFYSGEMGAAPAAIWSSVGIQVGGIGSSFGVLGSWTTVFHDTEDPVGPFWMQKRETKQTNVNT